jgi:acetyl-CoA carboxylase biotin carboxyl carrier protein
VANLADELVPALIARLSAAGLAEIEVREGPWKIRLRRPMELAGGGRRSTDRQLRLQGPGSGPAGGAGGGGQRTASGAGTGSRVAPDGRSDGGRVESPGLPVASAPAVGIFRPGNDVVGRRVRAGDRLGAVDMLGVLQEVVAPVDGVAARLLAEAGDGVEYGQPLIEIQPVPVAGGSGDADDRVTGEVR